MKHVLVFGAPNAGKTKFISSLVDKVNIRQCFEYGCQVTKTADIYFIDADYGMFDYNNNETYDITFEIVHDEQKRLPDATRDAVKNKSGKYYTVRRMDTCKESYDFDMYSAKDIEKIKDIIYM